jgi:hypothetical protein
MNRRIRAHLRSSLGRGSKVLRDRERIEAIVEVAGAGTLVLAVEAGGGYSLRAYPEGSGEAGPGRDLLAVGVLRAEEIVAIRPEESSAEHEP